MSDIYYSKSNVHIENIRPNEENMFYEHMTKSMARNLSQYIMEKSTLEMKDLEDGSTDYKMSVAILSLTEYKRLKEIEKIYESLTL